MKISVISFTKTGQKMAERILKSMCGGDETIILYSKCSRKKTVQTAENSGDVTTQTFWVIPNKDSNVPTDNTGNTIAVQESVSAWAGEQMAAHHALVFVGACGIAVRAIAPWITDKLHDSPVLVMDEQGQYVIPLLSGHVGGANELTLLVAELTGAEPVITTATDLHGKFAVDAFAARRNLYMDSMPAAKEIAAALVDNLKVGMWSAFPVTGVIPPELDTEGEDPLGFSIDVQKTSPFEKTLHLVPKAVVLGIGCKRGTERAVIQELVEEVLEVNGIFRESICKIASIDLKKDETGILELAESYQVPFLTYPAEELKKAVCEDGFAESAFVESVTGVGNICERSALLAAGVQKLLIPKTARNGVTVAAAVMDLTICMED